jgi:hypothetical protein
MALELWAKDSSMIFSPLWDSVLSISERNRCPVSQRDGSINSRELNMAETCPKRVLPILQIGTFAGGFLPTWNSGSLVVQVLRFCLLASGPLRFCLAALLWGGVP